MYESTFVENLIKLTTLICLKTYENQNFDYIEQGKIAKVKA
jgi:hypothetical protein